MKKGIAGILGMIVGAAAVGHLSGRKVQEKTQKVDKFRGYYNMLNQWLSLKQQGKSLEQYFVDNGYQSVAIYGMGEMGNRLYDELKGTDKVTIKYAIDKNAGDAYSELQVLELEDDLPEVDVVIVTAIFAFDEILESLSERIDAPIVSLEDVVYEI